MNGLKILAFSTAALVISTASPEAAEPGKDGFTLAFSGLGPAPLAAPSDGLNVEPIIVLTPFAAVADDAASAVFGARLALSPAASLSLGSVLGVEPQGGLSPTISLILGFDYRF